LQVRKEVAHELEEIKGVFYDREKRVVVGVCAIGVAERIEDAQGCSKEASVASELHRHHLHVGLAWQFVEKITSKAPRI
jgi:hypothetical protein